MEEAALDARYVPVTLGANEVTETITIRHPGKTTTFRSSAYPSRKRGSLYQLAIDRNIVIMLQGELN